MRIMLEMESEEEFPEWAFGKHSIQAMIYTFLSGTPYEELHNRKGFKFFTFSDIFPSGHFRPGVRKRLIISSPDGGFIETLYERMLPHEKVYFGRHALNVMSIKKFTIKPKKAFITGSPVVVKAPLGKGKFFTFHHFNDVKYFSERLKENAVNKFRAFTGEYFELEGPLFSRMIPRIRRKGWLDVYVRVNIRGRYFDIPGTTWEYLEIPRGGDREFYTFLMDAGIGILNSLGFGFLNPVKENKKRGGNDGH